MWRHYLLERIFFLMTEQFVLKYLFDQPRLNARHARWMALIIEFYFEIKHIKGKENKVADALSQSVQTIHSAVASVGESDIQQRIKTLSQKEEFVNDVKKILQQEPKERKYEGYQLGDNNLLLYNNKLYVLSSVELRNMIIDEFHKRPFVVHIGYYKVVIAVRKLYYWPRMKRDIARYIAKCLECQ
jgi:hypothetical protein